MSSKAQNNRKRAAKEIEEFGEVKILACNHCFEHGIRCVKMSFSRSLKCASCAKKGIKCVDASWDSLDRTRETTRSDIEKDMDELEQLMERQREVAARIARKRKVLKLAEERAKAKTICLLDELETEEEVERVKNGGFSNGELEELSLGFVAYNNATENAGKEVWSAWDTARAGPTVSSPPGHNREAPTLGGPGGTGV